MNKKLERKHRRANPNNHFKIGDRVQRVSAKKVEILGYDSQHYLTNCSWELGKKYIINKISYEICYGKLCQLLYFKGFYIRSISINMATSLNSSEFFEYPRKQKIQNLLQHI